MEDENADEWDMYRRDRQAPAARDVGGWQPVTSKNKGNRKDKQREVRRIPKTTEYGSTTTSCHQPKGRGYRPSRRWENARDQQSGPLPPPRAPKLLIDIEDPSQAQWRAHEPARATLRTPLALLVDGEQTATMHETLASQHNAFIFSVEQQQQVQHSDSVIFGLWGEGQAVENARTAILAWIESMLGHKKSDKTPKFAKVVSLTPGLRTRAESRWKRAVQKQRFRQHPPLNAMFAATATFHWPNKEYPPHEILGSSYEALDPIRMDCSCYIVWKRDAFLVMGTNTEKVKVALLRLRRTVFQIVAKQLPSVRMVLMHHQGSAATVHLERYDQPRMLTGPVTHEEPKLSPRAIGLHSCRVSKQLQRRMHRSLMTTLTKLPYLRGSVHMRVHFGRFIAVQYRIPDNGEFYELSDFEAMTNESQFHGEISEELGDREIEQAALRALQGANGMLMPLDNSLDELSDVKPVYTVVFTFADKAGDLRFLTSWQQVQDTGSTTPSFEPISQKWTRLDKDTGTTASLVDISVADLKTAFGWAFTVEAAQSVEEGRLPAALVNFAHTVQIDANAALCQSTSRPFATFNASLPHIALKSVQQRITYQYCPSDCEYTVELTRFQSIVYLGRKSGSLIAGDHRKVYEPRWGLSVFYREWDAMFASNERLPVGTLAPWEPASNIWFPRNFSARDEQSDEESFGNLIAMLEKLGELLSSCKIGDLLGGMNID